MSKKEKFIKKNKTIKKILKIGIILTLLFFYSLNNAIAQDAETYYQNGYQYFTQGDYKKSEELYKKAIDLDPNFENAYYWLGKVYRQTGQYDKAIPQWIEVLRINPRNSYAFRYLNDSFRDTSRVANGTASDYCSEGLKILNIIKDEFLNENSVNSYTLLSAIPYFKRAVELDDDYSPAYYWVGEIYQALSKKISWQYTSLAISSFEKVIAIEEDKNRFQFQKDSEYWHAYQELIRLFQSLGLNERKESLLNQLLEAKSMPYEKVLKDAGYDNLGYPDTIEIIWSDSDELIERWSFEKDELVLRVVNKKVVGQESSYLDSKVHP